MSETDVNREDQTQEEKKVTFNEEKEKEPKEGEEIDEEGRASRVSRTGSVRSRTSSRSSGTTRKQSQTETKVSNREDSKHDDHLDCDNSDVEEDDNNSPSSKQTEAKPRRSIQSTHSDTKALDDNTNRTGEKVSRIETDDEKETTLHQSGSQQVSNTDTTKSEETTTKVDTDDDKEARRHSGSHQDSDESQKETSTSGYSLNSRTAAKTSQSDPASSEETTNSTTPRYMTDDEKVAESQPADSNSSKNTDVNDSNDIKTTDKTVESKETSDQPESADKNKTDSNDIVERDVKTDEKSKDEKKNKPQTPKVQVMTKPKPKSEQKPEQQKQQNERQKSSTNTANRERPWAQQARTPASSAKAKNTPKEPDRTMSPRQIVERDRLERRRKAQSARLPSDRQEPSPRDQSARGSSRASSRYYYRPPSRPRTCGYISEERRRKEKEFFYAELNRLKDSLKKESKKIKKPKVRDHYPDVFTSLEPYYNTYTANYLINMPDNGYKEDQPENAKEPVIEEDKQELKFQTRCTAIGLTDPWDSLNMDRSVLPKLETAEMRKKRMEQISTDPKRKSGSQKQSSSSNSPTPKSKRPEAKQGSTRLPKFPMIPPPNSDLTTKELNYTDVPMLRGEMAKSFSHSGDSKKKSDYTRTRQDFYRMELDRLDEYHKISRPHMRAAYFAYLQNTPGSKQAVYDCLKEVTTKKEEKPMTPQAVA